MLNALAFARKVSPTNPPMRRLWLLNMADNRRHETTAARIDRNVGRAGEYEQLAHCAEGQHVAIWIWERDCDCVEGTRRRLIRPTKQAYDQMVHNLYLGAEGPVSWSIHRPSEPFEAYTRDRVLEAFENGSSYSV